MSAIPFTPEPLFVIDNTSLNKEGSYKGRYTGTFDIINKPIPEEGYKWIGDTKPYGGGFPDYEEAKAYAKLFSAAPDMYNAIELALNIKDLWAPVNDPSIEHEGEAQALQAMLTALEAAIAKATT